MPRLILRSNLDYFANQCDVGHVGSGVTQWSNEILNLKILSISWKSTAIVSLGIKIRSEIFFLREIEIARFKKKSDELFYNENTFPKVKQQDEIVSKERADASILMIYLNLTQNLQ